MLDASEQEAGRPAPEHEVAARIALAGAARLAAFEMDARTPNDPHPEAQDDLRALATAAELGEPIVLTDGMRSAFEGLALAALAVSSEDVLCKAGLAMLDASLAQEAAGETFTAVEARRDANA